MTMLMEKKKRVRSKTEIELAMAHHTGILMAASGYDALCWVLGWKELDELAPKEKADRQEC